MRSYSSMTIKPPIRAPKLEHLFRLAFHAKSYTIMGQESKLDTAPGCQYHHLNQKYQRSQNDWLSQAPLIPCHNSDGHNAILVHHSANQVNSPRSRRSILKRPRTPRVGSSLSAFHCSGTASWNG